MNLYVMRHGQTVWNERGISQGRSQNRLSKIGKEQVQERAKEYAHVKFDIIYASPLMRTMQTANIMNRYHNVNIQKNNNLIEIDRGTFTGKMFNDLTDDQKILIMKNDEGCKMVSYKHLFDRVKIFVNFLKYDCRYDDVLIVTHERVASFIEHILTDTYLDLNDKKPLLHTKTLK